jgi:hypothetical protein
MAATVAVVVVVVVAVEQLYSYEVDLKTNRDDLVEGYVCQG